MVTIATVSDIHGQWKRPVYPPADVLIFAGDIFKNYDWDRDIDAEKQLVELREFTSFLCSLPYNEIIVVAGNHDFVFERATRAKAIEILDDHAITYLQDSEVIIKASDGKGSSRIGDGKYKVYGSPWQPFFCNWGFNFPSPELNPMRAKEAAKACWAKIPKDVDILITHGPPEGILDECPDGRHVGCPQLRRKLDEISPKLHVFGHIHASAGKDKVFDTVFKNTAILGEDYFFMRDITVEEV